MNNNYITLLFIPIHLLSAFILIVGLGWVGLGVLHLIEFNDLAESINCFITAKIFLLTATISKIKILNDMSDGRVSVLQFVVNKTSLLWTLYKKLGH